MPRSISSDFYHFNLLFAISGPERREKQEELKKQIKKLEIGEVIHDLIFQAEMRYFPNAEQVVHSVFWELTNAIYNPLKTSLASDVWTRNFLNAIALPTIQIFFSIQKTKQDKENYDLQIWNNLPNFIYSYICRNETQSQENVTKDIQTEIIKTYNGHYAIKAPLINKIATSIIKSIYYMQEMAMIPSTEPL
jgi:hypothetical protein